MEGFLFSLFNSKSKARAGHLIGDHNPIGSVWLKAIRLFFINSNFQILFQVLIFKFKFKLLFSILLLPIIYSEFLHSTFCVCMNWCMKRHITDSNFPLFKWGQRPGADRAAETCSTRSLIRFFCWSRSSHIIWFVKCTLLRVHPYQLCCQLVNSFVSCAYANIDVPILACPQTSRRAREAS